MSWTPLVSPRSWPTCFQLAHWLMSKTLFGPRAKVIEGQMDAWCMAKVKRLVDRFEEPQSPDKIKEWRLACGLEAIEYRDSPNQER
jgi:hypothetical protein